MDSPLTSTFNCHLPWGADVVRIVMHCFWYPFTYNKMDRKKKDKFDRTQVQMKGYRDVWYKTLSFPLHPKIRAACYQSDTGMAILFAMSIIHHTRTFDLFLVAFPKDHKNYFDPRSKSVNGSEMKKHFYVLLEVLTTLH